MVKGVKSVRMPNKRASGQSLVGCHVDESFLREIDEARGGKSRSDFLREALFELLKKQGHELPDRLKYGPDRTGKGGRPRAAVPPIETAMLNESTEVSEAAKAPRKSVKYPAGKRKPKAQ